MNRLELRMRYKAETAQGVECSTVSAYVGKYGDVICTDSLREDSMKLIKRFGYFEQDDPDYTRWLEEQLMTLLK